jgi:nicotinate-nucleotide adenylyltransferase
MKIGILGGTFDPIHFVHLMVAEQVREACQLDEIWFMPSHIPPHKLKKKITDSAHRLKMVELATDGISYFQVFPFELERTGPSYTVDTIRDIKKLYPEMDFHFIIGGDMVDYLPQWHEVEKLVEIVKLIGVHRPGYRPHNYFADEFVSYVEIPQMEISSTYIREQRRKGRTIRFMVPDPVRLYIEENGLYET